MFKTLIIAATASAVVHIATTLHKDKEILQLKKHITYLESHEYFSKIFQPAWEGGVNEGLHRSDLAKIRRAMNAHLN